MLWMHCSAQSRLSTWEKLMKTGMQKWHAEKEPGWIVPIAVGFHGISELGIVANQRDEKPEHRFAESVVTLGEFKMPYRFQSLDEIMWSYRADLGPRLICMQESTISSWRGS